MELTFFWKGLFLGVAVAAPVGPIGLLCIRRSLVLGPYHGFATGLGAAVADTLYGIIAGFGITGISTILISQKFWIHLIGALFLGYIGLKTFLSKGNSQAAETKSSTLFGSFLSSFLLTASNPLTILTFVAAFAALGLTDASGSFFSGATLVFGVFLGSSIWWLFLSSLSGFLRKKVTSTVLTLINRVSGAAIIALALGILAGLWL